MSEENPRLVGKKVAGSENTDLEINGKRIPVGNSIEELFKMMAMQAAQKEEKKPMEDYKFWKTQPVPKFDEDIMREGPIDDKTVDQVDKEAMKLPGDFEWVTVDIEDETQLDEVYQLLYYNYIEDDDESFRFKYSPSFLKWALQCPGWQKEWMVGVRATTSKKLVGFITAIPVKLRVRDNKPFDSVEVNFLCVHKKLRSKRLAPVLIREVTRRVNLKNVWQALYTGGKVLPSPICTSRYYHRSLNWSKLYDVGFAFLEPGSTPAKEVAQYALPKENTLKGWRRMTKKDVPEVKSLLDDYLSRFDIAPIYTPEEIEHWFVNPAQNPESTDIIVTYVVEEDGVVTDMISYFGIQSTVLGEEVKHENLNTAYSYYYATRAGISSDGKEVVDESALKKRLTVLTQNALISSKNQGYDVFNTLTVMDNNLFMTDLKFKAGSGFLRYYLFNYKAFPMNGGIDSLGELKKTEKTGGVGVLLF